MISKDKLIFDTSQADYNDNVGAFLRDASGALITSTNDSGKQALDVHVANTVDVTLTNSSLDVHNLDSIRFRKDATLVEVKEDTATPANSVPLPVKLFGATGTLTITAGDLNTQSDARGANYDSIRIGDGTNEAQISPNGDLLVADRANSAFKPTAVNVSATSALMVPTSLANRKWVEIQNLGNADIYIGDVTVTAANGLRVGRGSYWRGEIGSGVALYATCAASQASTGVRFIECA